MTDTPETRYVRTPAGPAVAYQVLGSGPDLVPWIVGHGNVEVEWTSPALARFFTRLGAFARVIRFDPAGSGVSDRISPDEWSIERCAHELISVLDAVGSERTTIFANNVNGLSAMYFAATYPERTASLVLDGCFARFGRDDDFPIGLPMDILQRALDQVDDPAQLERGELDANLWELLAPSYVDDEEFVSHRRRLTRAASSPGLSRLTARAFVMTDMRPLLDAIQAPTLVVCRADDEFAGPRHGRYLAEHIAGAKYVELPGRDNYSYVGDTDALIGEIEEFVTGARHRQELERVLTTILFTDIVESTDRAAAVGDRKWRELLERHDEISREEIRSFRGQFVKSTGDGVVATFDGPTRAVRCAQAITKRTAAIGLGVRSGLHTGEVEPRPNDLHGLAVHVAQRVCALAGAAEVRVSRTVVDLVAGSDILFEDHGEHELKGVPGTWRLSLVTA